VSRISSLEKEESRKMKCGNTQGREKEGKGSLKEDVVE
jgi:hypothetical protein